MKGKTLLAAMGYVDDALVQEAEDSTPVGKVIPLRRVQWMAALAACICILVSWAVFAPMIRDTAKFSGSGQSSTADTAATETTNEAAPAPQDSIDGGAALAEGGSAQSAAVAEEEAAAEDPVFTGGAEAPSTDTAGSEAHWGIAPIPANAVKELRVTHSLSGREETYTGADAAAVAEYINNLTLTADFDEDPNECDGSTYTLEFEMEDGTVRIFYHFGNAFFCEEGGSWYRMEYEEAAKLGELLGYVIYD